jgi:hypothetical protein
MENGRWTSAACVTPLTLGWLRPVIILPAGWPDWLPQKLEAVLTHEEEHARRRDPLIHSLALLNRAVFWFHPLAWWLEGRLSGLAEEACDAAVIERGHSPGEYADYVMEIARDVTRAGASININGVAMARNSLSQRLRSILEGAPAPRLSRARMLCLVMTCAAASSMFAAGVVEQRSAPLTELPLTTKRFTPETPEEAGNPLERSPESPTPAQVASLSPALQGTQEPGNNPQPRTQVFPVVIDPNEILQVMGVPPGSYNLFMTAPGIPCDTFALRIAPPRPGADLSMPIAPPSHTGDEAMAVVPCQPQEPGTLSQRYLKENPLQFGRSGGGTFQLERLREGGVQIGPLFTEPLAPKDRPRTDPCKYSEPSLRPLSCAYK